MIDLPSLPNLVAWSLQVAILVAVALLTMRLVRLEAPGVRYGSLRGVLLLCLALPLLQPAGAAGSAAVASSVSGLSVAANGRPSEAPAGAVLAALAGGTRPVIVWTVLVVGCLARLAWMAAGIVRLRRLRLLGEPAPESAAAEGVLRVVPARAAIRCVRGLGQPVTFGLRRPVVLIPESLLIKPPDIQRAVLAHELWHVRRRDWMWTVLEECLRALFWFHPAVWILISRIQAAREEVVDELTVLSTGSRRAYLDALIAYADEPPLFAATAFARRRHLVQRMVLISKEAVMSARRVVVCGAVLVAALASAAWVAVSAFPMVEQADVSGLDRIGPLEARAFAVTPENPVPRRTFFVPADYPSEAEALGLSGGFVMRVTLDVTGQVAEVRPVSVALRVKSGPSGAFSSTGSGGFTAGAHDLLARSVGADLRPAAEAAFDRALLAAVQAVRQWRYDAPAQGPLSFTVPVPFGPPAASPVAVPPPPSPAPLPSGDGSPSEPLRVGGGIKPPLKVRHVNPAYPPEAKEAGVQGVVILEARIEPDGRVGEARVLRSIPLLDEAAVEAVRQWEFQPTLLNGRAVAIVMTVTINFTLQ